MKLYKIEVYVIDHDNFGIDEVMECVAAADSTYISRVDGVEADIGEWSQDHPLNQSVTPVEEFRKYFK